MCLVILHPLLGLRQRSQNPAEKYCQGVEILPLSDGIFSHSLITADSTSSLSVRSDFEPSGFVTVTCVEEPFRVVPSMNLVFHAEVLCASTLDIFRKIVATFPSPAASFAAASRYRNSCWRLFARRLQSLRSLRDC